MGCKTSPFDEQKESFWKVKGALLEGKRSPFEKFFLFFLKKDGKTFGGYRKKLYLCTRFKELSNTAKSND